MEKKNDNDRFKIKDKSTIDSVGEYLILHLLVGTILPGIVYLFYHLIAPNQFAFGSIWKLYISVLFTCMIGTAISIQFRRNLNGIFEDVLLGISIFLFIKCKVLMMSGAAIIFYLFVAGLILFISITNLIGKIPLKKYRLRIIKLRLYRCLLSIRESMGYVSLGACVAFFGMIIVAGYDHNVSERIFFNEQDLSVDCFYDEETYGLEPNIETIKIFFDEEQYQSLSYEEKCELIETAVYVEACLLGLPKLTVKFKELGDTTFGAYLARDESITFNETAIKGEGMPATTGERTLYSCVHECRHAYQEKICDMYYDVTPKQRNLMLLKNLGVDEWIENEKNYISGTEEGYRTQPVEKDANSYARLELYYFERIIEELEEEYPADEDEEDIIENEDEWGV